jgi:hypothetical protein
MIGGRRGLLWRSSRDLATEMTRGRDDDLSGSLSGPDTYLKYAGVNLIAAALRK